MALKIGEDKFSYKREEKKNDKIVHLFKDALDEIKNYRNESQRVEFHIGLANDCVRDTGYKEWMDHTTRICERLGLKRGRRSQKNGGRPYASDQVVDVRAQFNKDVELLHQPLKVGDRVLSAWGQNVLSCFVVGNNDWICKFGTVPGNMSYVEKKFELQDHQWEE